MTVQWPQRIAIHDYPGHPFQPRLSRWLADTGREVLHLYSRDIESPKGETALIPNDSPTLEFRALGTGSPLAKYAPVRRGLQEGAYAARLYGAIRTASPDIVLSAAPPLPQAAALAACRSLKIPLVSWVQDIYAIGVQATFGHQSRFWGGLISKAVTLMEFGILTRSDGAVLISPDFADILKEENVALPVAKVIENWAPFDEGVPRFGKDNAWAQEHGLVDKFVFLTTGTLGLKHNPAHLVNLAEAFLPDPEVRIVVLSQGLGRQFLEAERRRRNLHNLLLLDYQPLPILPQILSCADVAILLLEPFAGRLSVPSRLYSYLWAGVPVLGATPENNLSGKTLERDAVGLRVAPDDQEGFVAAAKRLRTDSELRQTIRRIIERHPAHRSDMDEIGRAFLEAFRLSAGYAP